VYASAKFQLHVPNTFVVTALQSSNTRKINLYRKRWENKLQVLNKTVVTFKYNAVQCLKLLGSFLYKVMM